MSAKNCFLQNTGLCLAHCAAALSPVIVATPTASFSGSEIAPASPSIPLSPPKAITAWTQPVKEGNQYRITASCYNTIGTTAAGIPVHPNENPEPVVAVPRGTTHNVPFGTIIVITSPNTNKATYAVVADTGGFGQAANGKRHGVNRNTAMDLYSPVAQKLGSPSCKGFGKQDIIVEIVRVPPNPESYAGGKKQTETSLAKLAELAKTKQL